MDAASSVVRFVQGDDLHTNRPDPGYRIVPLDLPAAAAPQSFRGRPSRLLADAHRFIAFHGRAEELDRLRAWRDGREQFGVMLVHGAGGQGKTRLARELAGRSAASGWTLLTPRSGPALGPARLPADGRNRLVVVDHAERMPAPLIRSVLADARLHDRRTRILLLARPAGGWWQRIGRHVRDRFAVEPATLALNPLPAGSGQRERLFEAARDGFAKALEIPEALTVAPPGDWSPAATALEIQMRALAEVYGAERRDHVPAEPGAISAYLLGRELEHWAGPPTAGAQTAEEQTAGPQTAGETAGPQTAGRHSNARTVYLACLAGPLSHGEATALVAATGLAATAAEAGSLLDAHRASYPAGEAGFLAPIQPDRLAEDYIALWATGLHGFDADRWTANKLPVVLSALAPHRVSSFLATAVAVAQRWAAFGHDHLGVLLRSHPEAVLAAGGPLLDALARLTGLDAATLTALEAVMPLEGPPDVMAPLATLTLRLYRRLRETGAPETAYAPLGYRLARRLVEAGAARRALEPIDTAIGFWQLRPRYPAFSLARAYGCRAEALAGLDRHAEAVADARTSLRHWEAAGSASGLAAQLESLAGLLGQAGDPGAAAAHQAEATALWEALAEQDADVQVRLARSLSAEARYRRATGEHEASATAARKAAVAWQRIDRAIPDGRHRPDLLDAWSALTAARAAPAPLRLKAAGGAALGLGRLAARDITVLPRAAQAMAIWAILLTRAGRRDEAMDRAEEACRMSVWLVERYEERYVSLHAAVRLARARADGSRSVVDGAERFYRVTRAKHGTTAEDELVTALLREEPTG
ncbi:hypothetical protein ACFQS1_04860 [Paractinoplanes rhizophilus]|uniref:ATP-binding protein n=1 Tax=Paractinoplanes rhizophilus TaxID=1416877 RepID=A0ABW2HK88_9ACTN